MAITPDASSSGTSNSASTLNVSHTCTGSNLKLFVMLNIGGQNISSVTYNGVAMTQIGTTIALAGKCAMYYLDSPATGAHNITVTLGGLDIIEVVGQSYAGCASGLDNSTQGSENNASDTLPLTLTPVANGCWVVIGVGASNLGDIAAGNGSTTLRISASSLVQAAGIGDTNAAVIPAASTTLALKSNSGTSQIAGFIASFAPNTPPVSPSGFFFLTSR